MRFGHVSFSPIVGHVEMGLIISLIRHPQSREESRGNIVLLRLFLDCSHVIFLPSIPVIFTHNFGSFRCLWTDTCRGQNGCWSYTGHSRYRQEEFIAACSEKVVLQDPTGALYQEFTCCQHKFLLLPFTLK
jgi:hypothetical protein